MLRASLALLWLAGCGAARPVGNLAPPPQRSSAAVQVLDCAPAEVPASLMMERAAEADGAAARFEEARRVVLTTLGLYLGTGRWAEAAGRRAAAALPSRRGTEDECRALRGLVAGRTPPSFPSGPEGPLSVAGIVAVAYVPGTGGRPPLLLLRLGVLLCEDGGAVTRAAPVEVSVDYARAAPRYQERSPQEVAQEIVERTARALDQGLR